MNVTAIISTLTLSFCITVSAGCDNGPKGGSADLATAPADLAMAPADLTMAGGPKGKISGTVQYAGTKMGTLKFALYDQMPGPTTPPKYFMFPMVATPMFPQAYMLDAVEPGSYYVVVILDVPPANAAIPGAEDVVGSTMMKVTVPANGTGMIDVTLPNM